MHTVGVFNVAQWPAGPATIGQPQYRGRLDFYGPQGPMPGVFNGPQWPAGPVTIGRPAWRGRPDLGAYGAAHFPVPQNPLALGDIVPGAYPLPQIPVLALPKSPDMTQAMFQSDPPPDAVGCGGLGNCGCASCAGMGALDLATIEGLIPGTTFGIANTWLVLGAVAAFAIFSMNASRRGRR